MTIKKIFVTGATGFVGAHTAMALLDQGCSVKLLVRRAEFARQYFEAMGYVDGIEYLQGDMDNCAVIEAGIADCDALFHAAAMVDLDPANAELVYQTNVEGTKNLIEAALAAKLPRIVYVSSVAALFRRDGVAIDEDSPYGNLSGAYSRSKVDTDKYVRTKIEQGAPIVVSYPSSVMGGDDPALAESNKAVATFVNDILPITSSGIQIIDVRDLAQLHCRMLTEEYDVERYGHRFIIAGNYLPWATFASTLANVAERKVSKVAIPGFMFRALGSLVDGVRKLIPLSSPISRESMDIVTLWPSADSSRVQQAFGFAFRPVEDTLVYAIQGLEKSGQIKRLN